MIPNYGVVGIVTEEKLQEIVDLGYNYSAQRYELDKVELPKNRTFTAPSKGELDV